jgi:hypothetical protein
MEAKKLKNIDLMDLIVYEGGAENVLEENPTIEATVDDPVTARLINGVRAAYNGYQEVLMSLMTHLEDNLEDSH